MSSIPQMISDADTADRLRETVDAALRLRVGALQEQLTYEFLDEHADNSLRFFEEWVPRLEPLEQLQASEWVARECLTSLVHVPHAYGIGARIHLAALLNATRALTESLVGFSALTEGPDAELRPEVGARVSALVGQARLLGDELRTLKDSTAATLDVGRAN